MLVSCLYVSAAAIIFKGRVPSHPVFYGLGAFVCLNFLLTIPAINQQESLTTSFRIAIVLPLFIITTQLTKEHRIALVKGFVYICAAWVIYGVLIDQFRNGRFEGPLEYANTWGILLLTALIMSTMLAVIENKVRYVWLCSLLASGVILTGSRSVLILFIIVTPLQYLAIEKGNRKTILFIALVVCAGLTSAIVFPFSKWAYWGSFLVVSLLMYFIPKMRDRTILLALVTLLLVICGILIFANTDVALNRLVQISPHASEWTSRMGYYHDALSMIMNSLLLGYGGGAWNILQYHYQTAAYTVLYLHNHWLETWIETGIIGVLLLLTIVFTFIWKAISAYTKSSDSTKIWVASCLSAFGCLLVHSTVDFSFEYPLLFGLWVVFGIFCHTPFEKLESTSKFNKLDKPLRVLVLTVFFITSVISIRLSISEALTVQAEHTPSYTEAINLLERSSSLTFVPAEQKYKIAYLLLKNYLESHSSASLNRAAKEINKAYSMNPHDVHVLFLRCQILYAQGYTVQAKTELHKLQQQFPFRTDIQSELEKWK